MLLDWLGERHGRNALREAAGAVQRAVDDTLGDPASRTADLGGTLGTREFADAVCARLRQAAG
jgi:3-isopropylmalate dehydrogenase